MIPERRQTRQERENPQRIPSYWTSLAWLIAHDDDAMVVGAAACALAEAIIKASDEQWEARTEMWT